jgi:hypothetical protein
VTCDRSVGPARGGRAARSALLAAALLLALSSCESGGPSSPSGNASGTPTTAPSTPGPATGTTPPSRPLPLPPSCGGADLVEVTDAGQLQRALDDARPGRTIRLAAGTYAGNFVATAQGTPDSPIRLCGSRSAVLDGGNVDDGGYTLHLQKASHWQVLGLTVRGGGKGVMVDAGTGNLIQGLLVTSVGDEAIHLRTDSTDNGVVGNVVRDTGLRKPKYGEGIYIGSAESNWCRQTDCRPDRSDRNVIEANDIAGTTAESVDIKEGTSDGVLRGNVFDGSAMIEADSWVDVKGNDWRIEGNRGTTSPGDGFQVHEIVDGWGRGTVFVGNQASGVKGLAINAAGSSDLRDSTTVGCTNSTRGGAGLSNVQCSRG